MLKNNKTLNKPFLAIFFLKDEVIYHLIVKRRPTGFIHPLKRKSGLDFNQIQSGLYNLRF